jgi:hypothetical protein
VYSKEYTFPSFLLMQLCDWTKIINHRIFSWIAICNYFFFFLSSSFLNLTRFVIPVFLNSLARIHLPTSFWDGLYYIFPLAWYVIANFGRLSSCVLFGIFISILLVCLNFFYYALYSHLYPLYRHFFDGLILCPSNGLKNLICAASKRCSSLLFSTHVSLPYLRAAFAVALRILIIFW